MKTTSLLLLSGVVVTGVSAENERRTNIEEYAANGQAFFAYADRFLSLNEQPHSDSIIDIPHVYWFGPPHLFRDENGYVDSIVSHALEFVADPGDLREDGLSVPGVLAVEGFAAIWNDAQRCFDSVIADMNDGTNIRWQEAGRSRASLVAWETSAGSNTFGFTEAVRAEWTTNDDPRVKPLRDYVGMPLTPENFEKVYEVIYNGGTILPKTLPPKGKGEYKDDIFGKGGKGSGRRMSKGRGAIMMGSKSKKGDYYYDDYYYGEGDKGCGYDD